MPLTDAERERGAAHYRRNKLNGIGNGGGPQMGDDHPALAAVRDALDRLDTGQWSRFTAADLADGLGFSTKQVGQALARLAAEGLVERVSNFTPTVWTLVEDEQGAA